MIEINLFGLPDIHFAERDAETIKTAVVSGYEKAYHEATGEKITLYPGDPRRLFLLGIADVIILQRNIIDWTGKQNLLAYAAEDRLDHLGLLLGVRRLPAQHSLTTMRFTLSAPQLSAIIIPSGTRVTPEGTQAYFATTETTTIAAGEFYGDAPAEALSSGAEANGLLPGQINRLVDPLPYVGSAANITVSSGGSGVENDENLRERVRLAPESFSVAGARGAYEFWARTAHQSIVDVGILGPPDTEPGHVEIYPLLMGGELPTRDILDLVYSTCSAEDIRPLTDYVHVFSPLEVPYDLQVTYRIDRSRATQVIAIQAAVTEAVNAWINWQRSKLGRDINPSELNHLMVAAGAKRAEIVSPAFTILTRAQVAVQNSASVIFGGLEDG
ncbi:hypothetical protein FACS1894216_02690 [Synergistales bacterium]|nr:hypothetical protein FACS1894216_02690 [Synergistales bacterium]